YHKSRIHGGDVKVGFGPADFHVPKHDREQRKPFKHATELLGPAAAGCEPLQGNPKSMKACASCLLRRSTSRTERSISGQRKKCSPELPMTKFRTSLA